MQNILQSLLQFAVSFCSWCFVISENNCYDLQKCSSLSIIDGEEKTFYIKDRVFCVHDS